MTEQGVDIKNCHSFLFLGVVHLISSIFLHIPRILQQERIHLRGFNLEPPKKCMDKRVKLCHCQTTYPICRTEVDRFSEIVTLIKSCVIRSWKCDDKLTSHLVSPNNLQQTTSTIHSLIGRLLQYI